MDISVNEGEFHYWKDILEKTASSVTVQIEHGWNMDNCYAQVSTKSLTHQLGTHPLVHKDCISQAFSDDHVTIVGGQNDKE